MEHSTWMEALLYLFHKRIWTKNLQCGAEIIEVSLISGLFVPS
jgi:hypothetical protein